MEQRFSDKIGQQQEPAIEVRDVHEVFKVYAESRPGLRERLIHPGRSKYQEFHALNGVNVSIQPGERVGLIGHNGSGKSTLLKVMAKILPPDQGEVITRGRVATLLELGAGFSPELTGRENMYLNGSILGLTRKEITENFDDIVDFAGVRDFIDSPVKNYSSGMYVRLGFAIAVHVNPDILLVDEVLAVGDQHFQDRSLSRMREFAEAGKTVVLVSHDLGSIQTLCDRAILLEKGNVILDGPSSEVITEYKRRIESGKAYDLKVPKLPELHAHEPKGDDDSSKELKGVVIEDVWVDEIGATRRRPDPRPKRLAKSHPPELAWFNEDRLENILPGSRFRVGVRCKVEDDLIGKGGLYMRFHIHRADTNDAIYQANTAWSHLYLAVPPKGETFTVYAEGELNVLSGAWMLNVEVGNAETDEVHDTKVDAVSFRVIANPWEVGQADLRMTFEIDNPYGVWSPDAWPFDRKEGGPLEHPSPLWTLESLEKDLSEQETSEDN